MTTGFETLVTYVGQSHKSSLILQVSPNQKQKQETRVRQEKQKKSFVLHILTRNMVYSENVRYLPR